MAIGGAEQGAIIELMHGKYGQILEIEAQWQIRFQEGDMRPRIEHFHDAVRALTSGEASIYDKDSRLSVEHLASDIAHLRHIQDKPVGHINKSTERSLSTALVKKGEAGASYAKLPPSGVRTELAALYAGYTIFFAALFAPVAEKNYKTRVDEIDNTVSDLGLIEQIVEQLVSGRLTAEQAIQELMHVEHDQLRERLQQMLSNKKLSAKERQEIKAMLGQIEKGLDKEKKGVEQAHLSYATGQLAIYEQSKDMIKGLAAQGLNLAGKFLENSVRAAQQGKGRGI